MLNEDGTINLKYLEEDSNILKLEVRSRHASKKRYRLFIDYLPDSVGLSGIKRYYCECANGNRTIGCCSHVAAVIYYLSHARYLSKIVRPAEILTRLYDVENVEPTIDEGSDED